MHTSRPDEHVVHSLLHFVHIALAALLPSATFPVVCVHSHSWCHMNESCKKSTIMRCRPMAARLDRYQARSTLEARLFLGTCTAGWVGEAKAGWWAAGGEQAGAAACRS